MFQHMKMEAFINHNCEKVTSKGGRRTILLIYACIVHQVTAKELFFDGTLFSNQNGTPHSNSHSSRINDPTAADTYGNFAPNKSQLWIDENGNPEMQYYVEISNPDLDLVVVEQLLAMATSQWSKYTCVTFKSVGHAQCSKPESLTHGVLIVATFFYKCCSSEFGNQFSLQGKEKSCQKMCIDLREDRCSYLDIRELLSYTLGLLSPMNRPDRDDYVTFHPEHMDIAMWPPVPHNHIQRWRRMAKCPPSQATHTVPVPFDLFSSRIPMTSQFVDGHADLAVVVTRDRKKQYLLEHRLSSCPDLSHFDIYQVNKGYGCDKRYAMECLKSQKTVPKCLNYGYLTKNCTCACPKQFTGDRCQTKTNASNFCIDNVWFLDISNVTNITTIDTANVGIEVPKINSSEGYLFNKLYAVLREHYQYLTITIRPAVAVDHISVTLNFTEAQKIIDRINGARPERLIAEVMKQECGKAVEGFAILWGGSARGRPVIWCFSSFFLNEPSPAMLRSREAGAFQLLARSSIGVEYRDPRLTVHSLMFRIEASSFGVMRRENHSDASENATESGGARSSGDGGVGADFWAEALLSDASPTGVISAGVIGVLLLVGIALVGLCAPRCCRTDDEDDQVHLDDSGDEADDWNSD